MMQSQLFVQCAWDVEKTSVLCVITKDYHSKPKDPHK